MEIPSNSVCQCVGMHVCKIEEHILATVMNGKLSAESIKVEKKTQIGIEKDSF